MYVLSSLASQVSVRLPVCPRGLVAAGLEVDVLRREGAELRQERGADLARAAAVEEGRGLARVPVEVQEAGYLAWRTKDREIE